MERQNRYMELVVHGAYELHDHTKPEIKQVIQQRLKKYEFEPKFLSVYKDLQNLVFCLQCKLERRQTHGLTKKHHEGMQAYAQLPPPELYDRIEEHIYDLSSYYEYKQIRPLFSALLYLANEN